MKITFGTARRLLIDAAEREERFIIHSIELGLRNYDEIKEALDRYTVLLSASDLLLKAEQHEDKT